MLWKEKKRKIIYYILCIGIACCLIGCKGNRSKETIEERNKETIELVWYQVGETQEDMDMVLKKVNEYTAQKIGVTLKVIQVGWNEYNKKMQMVMNTGDSYDLAFTSSWTNDYLLYAQKGFFLPLDDLLPVYGKEMYENIDEKFWAAAKVGEHIYAVPSEKELGNMPMWVFNKEYVDKYNIPYQEIHTLEDLEPWLKLIKEKEPDVVPLYLTRDFTLPIYMDVIQEPIGIEYDKDSLIVQNLYETERMKSTLKTIRKYYLAGYINKNAAIVSDNQNVKRFVTKGDGQPYVNLTWSRSLGQEVVTSSIMEVRVTNSSARGALTAISKNSKHPEKAVEFLNLLNTDEYLRNLLNYGIEGVHYEKVPITKEEKNIKKENGMYDIKVHLIPEKQKDYAVSYWVMGGLFHTYVLEDEPIDKWVKFREFNQKSEFVPSFGFYFDASPVMSQISGFRSILDEFGTPLHTGSVDPDIYLPRLNEKLKKAGIEDVIEEMQKQIDHWNRQK